MLPSPTEPSASEHEAVAPQHRQLLLQLAAAFAVLSLAWPWFAYSGRELPWLQTTLAIGGVAFAFACWTHQAWWWRGIHLVFAPLAWIVSRLAIDPGWFLLAFAVLLLVYRGALGGQVPLYFSNPQTATTLAALTAERTGMRFIDLGAGIGSLLAPLARLRPDAHLTGVENAPATWLAGRLRTARLDNCDWRWGDFWQTDFAGFDVVYAFLSPAPMAALWEKARREMSPGSLLVSNSFAVPGREPDRVVEVGDRRQTRLYCYRL